MPDGALGEALHVTCHEIGALHEAALEGRFHERALDLVSAHFPQAAILYFRQDPAQPGGCGILHRGLGDGAMPALPLHLARANPLVHAHRQRPVGLVFHDDALMARAGFRATGFFRDWLCKAGEFDAATGVVISRDGPVQTSLEIRYPAHAARRIAPEAAHFLEDLAPHLQHATRTAALALDAGQARRAAHHVLELSGFPTFVVAQDGLVEMMNGRAENLLRNGSGLILGMDRRLQTSDAEDGARLSDAIAGLGQSPRPRSTIIGLRAGKNGAQKLMTLTPLAALGRNESAICDGSDAGRVAIMVIDGVDQLHLGRDALWRMFDLTAREVELAQALLEGRTLPELARIHAVSKQTLRNQLSSIMRKTCTRRQSELVALLLQMARALPL